MAYITEEKRQTEIIVNTDVAVCGGGIAGIAAALSAARAGKKVLLIENEFMLGGLATAGLINEFLPLCDGCGHQVSFGICEEMILLSERYGKYRPIPDEWLTPHSPEERAERRYHNYFHPEVFAMQYEQVLLDAGVEILYGARAVGVTEQDGKITHLIIEDKRGRSAIAVTAVVDASGDADLCELSSADTARFAAGTPLAAWYNFVKDGKVCQHRLGASDNVDQNGNYITHGAPIGTHHYSGIDDLSEMTVDAHRVILSHATAAGEFDLGYAPVTIPTLPQVRMTRRVVGAAAMDRADDKKFMPDSVGMFASWKTRGPVYEIPFGALYSPKVKNLLVAGRCISVGDTMWDLTRVIPVCAVTGEAAGLAAALTDDIPDFDVTRLQTELKKRGIPLHTDEIYQ